MMDVTSCYGDMFLFTQDPWAQNHQNLTLPPKVGIFSISSFLLGDGGLRYIYTIIWVNLITTSLFDRTLESWLIRGIIPKWPKYSGE